MKDPDLYELPPDEIERFDFLFAVDPALLELVNDCARHWRSQFRTTFSTHEECRWAMLRRSLACSMKPDGNPQAKMAELPTLARYLCWRIEQRVIELDASSTQFPKK